MTELYRAAREAYTNGEWAESEGGRVWLISKEVYEMLQEACERYEQMTNSQRVEP